MYQSGPLFLAHSKLRKWQRKLARVQNKVKQCQKRIATIVQHERQQAYAESQRRKLVTGSYGYVHQKSACR